jgi:hypothetical protein
MKIKIKDETKKLIKCAAIRAYRTFFQSFCASTATTAALTDVNWPVVLSTAGLATLIAFGQAIYTGLPEAKDNE